MFEGLTAEMMAEVLRMEVYNTNRLLELRAKENRNENDNEMLAMLEELLPESHKAMCIMFIKHLGVRVAGFDKPH